ncbi:MAG: hypothetical protein P9X24_03190, partial [Candidatus Hatepunaea meridiana]|nr:hypothetical protein [Candidatus Hatepunaea meridiana]
SRLQFCGLPTTGLSRMRGNPHVRFLGGDGAATHCPYPTKLASGSGLWALNKPEVLNPNHNPKPKA